jgi:hypothetical protein
LNELEEGGYEIAVQGQPLQVDAAKSGRPIDSVIRDGRPFEAMLDEEGSHGFDALAAGCGWASARGALGRLAAGLLLRIGSG